MKGKVIFLILLLLGAYAYVNGYISPDDVRSAVNDLTGKENGDATSTLTPSEIPGNVSVSTVNGSTYVRLDVPAVNENLTGLLYRVAVERNATRVDAYYLGEPVLRLTKTNGSYTFEDIRTPEFRIRTDLALFDVNVFDVDVTNETAAVSLEYLADGGSFWNDYFKMAFAVLENAPWVEEVRITYIGERNATFSISSENLLHAWEGKLTAEELANAVREDST
ncbi:hypothetical protein TEU_01250 [Thermococcus eurythermalis]|uniref:Uncharacterized protein n=1 Tax=Thermococcus eurythermalis TaxID=1505907 RepID=A0A097QRH9_9EURY|nr:hypothetical protein [Thermococcus eurythermalis]AIU69073.1 hypothetical protein TEU_01250 [Thermococcus eurythermalis]